jgi:hypothetical protein
MSKSGRDWGKWLKKFFTEDIRIIAIFLLALLTLTYGFTMLIGWAAPYGATITTPSQASWEKNRLDSDHDSLSDIIEGTPSQPCVRGEDVYDQNNEKVGECTGTNPYDPDTDGDFFPDNAEDALGTNPNNPLDPGWVFLIWIIAIGWFVAMRFYRSDPLEEYRKFEELESGSVTGKGEGKFAYGTSSVFSKRVSEMSEEERKEAIQQDSRFQRLTAESKEVPPQEPRKRINYKRLLFQAGVAIVIGAIIVFVGQQT